MVTGLPNVHRFEISSQDYFSIALGTQNFIVLNTDYVLSVTDNINENDVLFLTNNGKNPHLVSVLQVFTYTNVDYLAQYKILISFKVLR